jgi:ElaB/YqjD/DUF883 family membrane-anchored ribosome-binding protein
MDSTADRELEMIRDDAHQTRAALANKLEALESQVSQTVAGVTSAVETVSNSVAGVTSAVESVASTVSDTVATVSDKVATVTDSVSNTMQNVTEAVSSTVQNVTESLDVTPTIRSHPWASVGCAFAAGFAGGYLSGSNRADGAPPPPPYTPPVQNFSSPEADRNGEAPTYKAVGDAVSEIGGAVKSLGISALMGVVTHLARSAVPEALRSDVCGAMEKLKTRLGGHHDVPAELFETKK